MDFDELLSVVSEPRLSYYTSYLKCDTKPSKIGAYYAFQELSGKFFPLVQMVEVSLRNSIHRVAREHYSDETWYLNFPSSPKSRSTVENAVDKANSELSVLPSADDIVCRLTLGFWVYMLDKEYRDTSSHSYLWTPENKKKVFPNARNPWGADLSVKAIFDEFQQVLILRNRLFHHEPIWKKHNCNSIEQAITNVLKNYQFLLKMLSYISPAKMTLMDVMESPKLFYAECNLERITSTIERLNNLSLES